MIKGGFTLPDRATRPPQRPTRLVVQGGPDRAVPVRGGPASSPAGRAVRAAEAGHPSPPAARAATAAEGAATPELGQAEELLVVLRGIGAVMFLTTDRIIVARDGFERRPRTGIQSFALHTIRHLRLELGAAPSGRIVWASLTGQEAVSMFFDARSLDRVHELIDVARPLIARERRRGDGAGPVRPPIGPARSNSSDPT